MSIAILTPSRGRPEQFAEMVDSIRQTADGPVGLYIGFDDDDPSPYEPVHADYYPGGKLLRVTTNWRPRQQLAGWTNDLAKQAIEDGYTILASFGDDHRPRTQGWDTAVENAMRDMGPGLVYTADGLQNEALPTAPFWHASIIRELGWFFPPVLNHMYADNWWLMAATQLGRCTYLPDVLIEHLHPSTGKSVEDDINRENDSHYAHDEQAYALFLASPQQREALDRVRPVL